MMGEETHSDPSEENPLTDDDSDLDLDDIEETDEDECDSEDIEEEVDAEEVAKKKPARIRLDETAFDLAFHPSKDIITIGEISGKVSLFSYSNEENKKLLDFKHQKKACRCVSFSLDGARLYSGSQDNSIYCTDMNTGSVLHSFSNSHDQSISSMLVFSDNFIASGCEGGIVKVWDTRTFSLVSEFPKRKDYISDLTCDNQKKHLLSTSGDGVLSVFNLRKNCLVQESDQLDDELLCIDIIKNGKKVVCGSATGVLNVFSWGEWGDISDRYPTESDYIESLCTISDDIICTGADDGYIKAMFVQPYKDIKTIGRHGDMGVATLKLSPNKNLLASCGGDENVRFWDISSLHDESMDQEERKGVKRKRAGAGGDASKAAEFFADL